ncbi:ABC transporter substrate-binding protein [Cellulomonas triticagri]|uniref:Amino acid ABC transporter substrate-binding protein n=1 Tax=Cellulomonas triticagri TaxID=2483352 RepID=A0A3M2J664_9CELL|nr:ABC transporter substrate-binding protein [Cellulomonas triticagri]RMI07023.1 amino acid ABC transporter substrate-binding protein [Cellulomonas triticagri]
MRTRHLAAVPVAAAAALLLAACGGGDSSSGDAEGGVELVSAGSLTLCTNPPYEPFEYEEGGEVVGLDIDIVNEVATDLGVELVTKVTPFEGIQSGADLNTNNCDVVASGITITPERQEKIDFSDPYFDANQGLLVPEGSDLSSLDSLDGKKIGVQQATTGETWAQDNGLETIQFEDLGLQVQALRTGQVDAVVNDIAVLGPYVSEGFEIGNEFSTGEQYGIGVKQGNTALLDAVNATLERIREDGTYDDIYTQYIGTAPGQAETAEPTDG